jgi:hypothetical protein
MATARLTLPIGPLAPFIVALGAEASYQTITGTGFQNVTIGPAIMFGG